MFTIRPFHWRGKDRGSRGGFSPFVKAKGKSKEEHSNMKEENIP
jgi:hypothetical protein